VRLDQPLLALKELGEPSLGQRGQLVELGDRLIACLPDRHQHLDFRTLDRRQHGSLRIPIDTE